jgi:hypothetical protein
MPRRTIDILDITGISSRHRESFTKTISFLKNLQLNWAIRPFLGSIMLRIISLIPSFKFLSGSNLPFSFIASSL